MIFSKKNVIAMVTSSALIISSASVSATTILKLSHNQNRTHPVHKSMTVFAKKVQEYTHGDVKIRIYPNSQLGTQRESMELLQNGALDMAKSNASELESFAPAYGAFNIPYLFHSREHFYKALTSKVGRDILNSSKGKGFIGLTYYDGGARSFYANKAIRSPADLKSMKIRVQPSPTAVQMIKLMGGSPTPLAYGELYTALQQGVVDGAENNPTALTSSRHGEVAKVYSMDEHAMIPDVLVISERSWNKLSADDQKAMRKAAKESMMYHKKLWTKVIKKSMEKAKNSMGVEFVKVKKQPFIDAVKPLHEKALNNPEIAKYVKAIDALAQD
ncbi:2,3-diketo-L-gulonate-binding periplasmic protein YiaO precursor [Vibrio palustris]|uniref:2,3-diketo-L-gulonate-binding periplasmic protein YiaO n=1 Tax=Vibrio palustris TaxID=1918946 RepID=A0A1R4B512_9VIBR|nr:2,3-diketo-L-gulonate-binding periplasmic protein YiaO precursor [Vibrio palustris]